mmetsp:Transcript_18659/g.46848  ORF Transcript_18659/g.46848 Transcript_18659/m.46848 type:complete len:284 (+) Transcript_18659:816-1667(+)
MNHTSTSAPTRPREVLRPPPVPRRVVDVRQHMIRRPFRPRHRLHRGHRRRRERRRVHHDPHVRPAVPAKREVRGRPEGRGAVGARPEHGQGGVVEERPRERGRRGGGRIFAARRGSDNELRHRVPVGGRPSCFQTDRRHGTRGQRLPGVFEDQRGVVFAARARRDVARLRADDVEAVRGVAAEDGGGEVAACRAVDAVVVDVQHTGGVIGEPRRFLPERRHPLRRRGRPATTTRWPPWFFPGSDDAGGAEQKGANRHERGDCGAGRRRRRSRTRYEVVRGVHG